MRLSCGRRALLVLAVASLAFPAAIGGDPAARLPGREILLPHAEVGETFLGYMIGLIQADIAALLDPEYLLEILPELKDSPGLRLIRNVGWQSGSRSGGGTLSFWFQDEFHFPVPINIFGYHPGSIDASSAIVLQETRRGWGRGTMAGPFHLFAIERGHARVDFDEWLDVLAGPLLDDFSLDAVALLTFHGAWHALLVGRGTRDQAVPWAVNLGRNQIVFPLPGELVRLADRLLHANGQDPQLP